MAQNEAQQVEVCHFDVAVHLFQNAQKTTTEMSNKMSPHHKSLEAPRSQSDLNKKTYLSPGHAVEHMH